MVFASNNKSKLQEIKEIFNDYKIESLKDKNVTLDVEEDKTTFYENALKKVLSTLIENALERTESGAINLAVTHPDESCLDAAGIDTTKGLPAESYIMIQITDSSQGLAEDELKNIFDPYANIDKYLAKKNVSKSLEMGIVYMLVRILKGRINVESQPEQGCVFMFIIPAEKISL